MKFILPLFLALCLFLPFLFGCDTDKPTYTKHLPAKTDDISWEDRMTEDAVTVSSVLSYSREEVERPGGVTFIGMQKYTYAAEDGLYLPVKRQTDGEYAYRTTIYHYGTDGALTEEIEIPYETECAELFRVLSDGRILLLETTGLMDFSKVSLRMLASDGEVLYQSPQFSFSTSVFSFIDQNYHGMHVSERDDGSVRILVNAINRVYYFDETLTLLNEVALSMECRGIFPVSDGVYMMGDGYPAYCRVDLNSGTAEQADAPVLPEMTYFSTLMCGGDGQMYCSYKDAVYLCGKTEDGGDTMHQLLNWYQGSCDGQGIYWIVNESCMFYVPQSGMTGRTSIYLLRLGSNPDLQNRRVLTLVSLSGYDVEEWYLDVISQFNESSDEYYILYVDLTDTLNGDFPVDRFDSYLLDGNKPDMVLFDHGYRPYAKKNLLLDLSADYGECLLNAARNAYTEGSGAMYVLPLNMMINTYACNSSLLDGPLTWDDMYAFGEELKASDPDAYIALTTVDFEINDVYNLMRQYVDYETMTSSFHSDEFHRQVRFKEEMMQYVIEDYGTFQNSDFLTGGRYGISGSTEIVSALADGRVKLSYFPFYSLTGYASLKLFFGDTPFSLCGYPSDDDSRYAIQMQSLGLLSVFADSANLGGCKAFLDFILSDDMQTSQLLAEHMLPVTRSAMERLIDENRYFYYSKNFGTVAGMDPNVITLILEPMMANRFLDESKASSYTVVEITDEDKANMMSFFDNCISYAHPDETIRDILNEELSVYRAGVRTLEETTKIIDSRVWIYLNE